MERTLTDLTCPKCAGQMRAQERQGIVIEVCTTCRGVFLDRGELDRLLDLEASAVQPGPGYADVGPHPDLRRSAYDPDTIGSDPRGRRRDDDDDDDDFRGRGGRGRGGFLEDLFGGFGD